MTTFLRIGIAAVLMATGLAAHHGWSGYDESKPLTLTGVVKASSYENPHTYVDIQVDAKLWHAVLAPPSRMSSRGIKKDHIQPGATVTVQGFQDKAKPNEVKIERITINGKTTEIRR